MHGSIQINCLTKKKKKDPQGQNVVPIISRERPQKQNVITGSRLRSQGWGRLQSGLCFRGQPWSVRVSLFLKEGPSENLM